MDLSQLLALLLVWKEQHHLPDTTFNELLKILRLLPAEYSFPKNLHAFNKYFEDLKLVESMQIEMCKNCNRQVEGGERTCENCQTDLRQNDKKTTNFFIQLDLKEQIGEICRRPGILDKIKGFKVREEGTICDVVDGHLWHKEKPVLGKEFNISLMMNTDGVPVFKSSSISMWPVYLVINELPYVERMKLKNVLLACLWYGDAKPNHHFLNGMCRQLQELYSTGVVVNDDVTVRAVLIGCTADAPARAMVMSMKQHNGFHGCGACYNPGTRIASSSHSYIWDPEATKRKRTQRSTIADLETLVSEDKFSSGVNGVKGVPLLLHAPGFDIIDGMSKDYMHCALLGVVNGLLSLWFDDKHAKEAWYLGDYQGDIDAMLVNIAPPSSIKRLPRSLGERKRWKAAELKSWVLFYAPVLLKKFDHFEVFYENFVFFVSALWSLLQERITAREIVIAEKQLKYFVWSYERLYGQEKCVSNIHTLLHLGETVRNLGPLWANSCFPFEDMNGKLLDVINGTSNFAQQIVRAVTVVQRLPSLSSKIFLGAPEAEKLFHEIFEGVVTRQLIFEIQPGMFAIGGLCDRPVLQADVQRLLEQIRNGNEVGSFSRLLKNGCMIQAKSYTRAGRHNNSCVMLDDGSVGEVRTFIQIGRESAVHFAMIDVFTTEAKVKLHTEKNAIIEAKLAHIQVLEQKSELKAVRISKIKDRCLKVTCDDIIYVVKFPNKVEFE